MFGVREDEPAPRIGAGLHRMPSTEERRHPTALRAHLRGSPNSMRQTRRRGGWPSRSKPTAFVLRTARRHPSFGVTPQLRWEAVLPVYPSGAGKEDEIAVYSAARSTR